MQTHAALPVDPAAIQGTMVGLMLGAAIAQLGPDTLRWRPRRLAVQAPQPVEQRPVAPPLQEQQPLPPLWELVWRPLVPVVAPQVEQRPPEGGVPKARSNQPPQLMLEVCDM